MSSFEKDKYVFWGAKKKKLNQWCSESHLVNTKVYKAKFSLVDVSVNAKKYY